MSTLENDYDWISSEKSLFGCAGSPYDFKEYPPKDIARRLEKLKETKDRLSQSVNMRAMSLLGKQEERVSENCIFSCKS